MVRSTLGYEFGRALISLMEPTQVMKCVALNRAVVAVAATATSRKLEQKEGSVFPAIRRHLFCLQLTKVARKMATPSS